MAADRQGRGGAAVNREIEAWRQERTWQLQSARLYLAAARAREQHPGHSWLPHIPSGQLQARASEAVRRARLAHLELMAVRRLHHDSLASRISQLAHQKSLQQQGTLYVDRIP